MPAERIYMPDSAVGDAGRLVAGLLAADPELAMARLHRLDRGALLTLVAGFAVAVASTIRSACPAADDATAAALALSWGAQCEAAVSSERAELEAAGVPT